MTVPGIDAVYVATDDRRISDVCEAFGASVVMTSPECRNGTERCAEALGKIAERPDIIINLQGDAPLTPPPPGYLRLPDPLPQSDGAPPTIAYQARFR